MVVEELLPSRARRAAGLRAFATPAARRARVALPLGRLFRAAAVVRLSEPGIRSCESLYFGTVHRTPRIHGPGGRVPAPP